MTSLIFGSIYMTHQGIMAHRRSKQREKNYQRWEDLRDEYDEQKKITRETRSLDIQRTGAWDQQPYYEEQYTARDERPILTLRDQQEANDARLSWRPQESWEPSHHHRSNNPFEVAPQRTASVPAIPPHLRPQPTSQPQQPHLQHATTTPSAYWQSRGEIKPQKTGATWDDGMPTPLRVSRRNFDDYDHNARRGSLPAQQSPAFNESQRQSRNNSAVPSRTGTPVQIQSRTVGSQRNSIDDLSAKIATISVDPIESHVPGGRMAELIERGY